MSKWERVEAGKDSREHDRSRELLVLVRLLLNKLSVNPFGDVRLGCLALKIKCYA